MLTPIALGLATGYLLMMAIVTNTKDAPSAIVFKVLPAIIGTICAVAVFA